VGQLDGKVAFITGAARGQGRSHAKTLAREGADIVAIDICKPIASSSVHLATPDDLEETVQEVEALDRRIVARQADVRDLAALRSAVADGVEELGGIDIVVANAGIISPGELASMDEETFTDMIDVNLTGVWRTLKATVPMMIEQGRGGAVVLTASMLGLRAVVNNAHYNAAKHGVIGLMRSMMNELGPHGIRVNAVLPGNVGTDMLHNDRSYKLFRPDLDAPTLDDVKGAFQAFSVLPGVPWVEAQDISNAVLFLVSDQSRYVTGANLPVDLGWLEKTI